MTQTRRERIRETTFEEIKSIAWKQIAEQGASSLSLRAIARAMGMTAPGLYRYYPSRDDLVTILMIDAFSSFAQFLETARDEVPVENHTERFRAVCRAYFAWAERCPERYSMIFGSPVPGYHMTEAVYPVAQRSFLILQGVIGEALEAGAIHPGQGDVPFSQGSLPPGKLPSSLLARLELLNQFGMPYSPTATHLALTTWSHMHGIASLYLYATLRSFLAEQVSTFVDIEIERLIVLLGFHEIS